MWRRMGVRSPSTPYAAAATCLEYYRKELEGRRDHLRNAWLWHGPLILAGATLIAIVIRGKAFQPFRNVLPLVVLLAVWTGLGIWRRHRQAKDLQPEIDKIKTPGTHTPFEQSETSFGTNVSSLQHAPSP